MLGTPQLSQRRLADSQEEWEEEEEEWGLGEEVAVNTQAGREATLFARSLGTTTCTGVELNL
jgi:hypothetical protein